MCMTFHLGFPITNVFVNETVIQVLWFSAIFPYVVLFILCIKALTLEGAGNGLKFLFTPQWERLYESQVWIGKWSWVEWSFYRQLVLFRWWHSDFLFVWSWHRRSSSPWKLQQVSPQLPS